MEIVGILFGVSLLLLILVVVGGIAGYNALIVQRNRCRNAEAQIDVQLKRRHDLIPNLVETVSGYATHERTLLENVTLARAKAVSAETIAEKAEAEDLLTRSLRSVFAVLEAYPELKANTNFLQLQDELSDTESKIGYARQFYNDTVMRYETLCQTFPTVLLAQIFGFKSVSYFNLSEDAVEKSVPVVSFSRLVKGG